MAAYGALLSLSNTLNHLLPPPPLSKIIVDTEHIQLLFDMVNFFIIFLENYPQSQRNEEIERVERRIADAAHAAEDIVESNVVDQIRAANNLGTYGERFYTLLCRGIQTVREKFISGLPITDRERFSTLTCQVIQTVVEKFISIKEELPMMMVRQGVEGLQLRSGASTVTDSSRLVPGGKKIIMVGFDHHLEKIMTELASDEPSRRVIPIVGMGGIGKTTLATAVYKHPYIVEYFDIRVWVTVSQEYTVQDLLNEINKVVQDKQGSSGNGLGLPLHKKLFSRRYLLIMDDVWDMKAWEELKRFLPPNENGSRVLVTSRLSNLANDLGSYAPHQIDFLDKGSSWDLLRKTIFKEEDCPVELEKIGRKIAEKCRGLPLALVLIGGLLGKSERIRWQWERFFGDEMTFALNFGNDEQLTKVLSLSYFHLPIHLKPCFLYLAAFPEDSRIRVSTLIHLWVSEGIIKPTRDKCLEEVAYEYLKDLISRNIILVSQRGSGGKVKYCQLHDRVRDLCIKEAEKQEFMHILKLHNSIISPNIENARRLSISTIGEPPEVTIETLRSAKFNRSWLSHRTFKTKLDLLPFYDFSTESSTLEMQEAHLLGKIDQVFDIISDFKLLKVVRVFDYALCIGFCNLCNLRYLDAKAVRSFLPMTLCWNLQILVIHKGWNSKLPVGIWQMTQLRHVDITLFDLPDLPDDQSMVVLENLHTLKTLNAFEVPEQVLKRIPNLKKLKIYASPEFPDVGSFLLYENLGCFKKLETLYIDCAIRSWASVTFPVSLKKLNLDDDYISWDYLSTIVGSLPNLEVLKLRRMRGDEWNPIEGKFNRLKFLKISWSELKIWGVENEHFPCLEHLVLRGMELEEIPINFAEISTLETIGLGEVKESMWSSARKISEEREQLGYGPLILLESAGRR